jgi:hypothetical protein
MNARADLEAGKGSLWRELQQRLMRSEARADIAEARVAELQRDLANECERRDDIINCEVHLRSEAEVRVARYRATLVEVRALLSAGHLDLALQRVEAAMKEHQDAVEIPRSSPTDGRRRA